MENTSEQSPRKTWIIWGVPILILVVLIILLISELTEDEEIASESVQVNEETIIQATDEEAEKVTIQVQPILEDKPEPIEETSGTEEIVTEDETQAENAMIVSHADEEEQSYIVDSGDSLWKIAKRKDVFGDAYKWKTILIQNREKINYTIFSEETGEWRVDVDAGKRLIVKPKTASRSKTSFDRTRKKRYAVQLMSLDIDQLDRAVNIVKFLIKDGYHAYLYRTREKIKIPNSAKSQYFYRIRVGFFETEGEALNVGQEIVENDERGVFPQDYWAVLPSYSELNGELIDFGIQRNKPWIIQLAEQGSRTEAINDLKSITSVAEFSYISQSQSPEGEFLYRTRVGFFENQKEAEKVLAKIQRNANKQFPSAEILEIRHVMEDAPGQSTGESSLKKLR